MSGEPSAAEAFFEPLSPIAFLTRSAAVYPDHVAVVDREVPTTYRDLHDRARQLSGALMDLGVERGDRVGLLVPNGRVGLEAHFGIPMAGAVLVPLNIHLTAAELAWIIGHSGMRVLIVDDSMSDRAVEAVTTSDVPVRIVRAGGAEDDYEHLLASSVPASRPVEDERSAISVNYTSGTSGRPKGVVAHHRGTYLQSLAMVVHLGLDRDSGYLWTLPLYHCNGWSFAWAVAAAGAVSICGPVEGDDLWRELRSGRVTHLCAAPSVLTPLAHHPASADGPLERVVRIGTGGAAPSVALLDRLDGLGLAVTHLYGLTETFGPAVICEPRPRSELGGDRPRDLRQGVVNLVGGELRVLAEDGTAVPPDGEAVGEVVIRGNNVMLGYFGDDGTVEEPFVDGWFHTGDLAVLHPDGYIELRDRARDVIKFSGEAISPLEVEDVIACHPAVLEAAVVGRPAGPWGESPVAFVHVREGHDVTAAELRAFVATRLSDYKVPTRVIFSALPKTSTGKVRKHVLRTELGAGP